MKKTYFNVCMLAFAAIIALVSCNGQSGNDSREAQELAGAGATFPLPFYNAVFENFEKVHGDVVAYGAIGSGGGVRNLCDKIVDFAGSDAFVSDKELAEMEEVVHIPTCMGAVVLAYNIDGVDSLVLSGELIADIFGGKIKNWSDSRIAALNPQAKLPDAEIIPVYRSDGSGTTFVFTDYLSKVSTEWASKYGAGKSVNFPSGQAAKGNPGVANVISQTKNTIGYVGSEYAFAQNITFAKIKNQRGEVVNPNPTSISASASGDIPADTRTSITNSDAAGAYPISCFTWIVIYKEQKYSDRTKEQAVATLDLLQYILSDEAQRMLPQIHYAPLPEKVKELCKKNLQTVTYEGKAILDKQ